MCDVHAKIYRDAMTKPIRGITPPENAGEDWRLSLSECLRHASIALAFENRNKCNITTQSSLQREGDAKRYSHAQLEQVMILRKQMRNLQINDQRLTKDNE
jgi:hypothetical protein